MIPSLLAIEICQHLASLDYDLITMPDPPENGPAAAAFIFQKNRVRYLVLVAILDGRCPYLATPDEQIDQYVLQKQQLAKHTVVITVVGDPWQIIYPSSL